MLYDSNPLLKTPLFQLLGVGSNTCNQLGTNAHSSRRKPFPIPDFPANVMQVVSGCFQTMALVSSGMSHDIFTWGAADNGCLGRPVGPGFEEWKPTIVHLPMKTVVKKMTAGDLHCAVQTAEQIVMFWGSFRWDNGSMEAEYPKPVQLDVDRDRRIGDIASGSNHLLMLTSGAKPTLYALGANDQFQKGCTAGYKPPPKKSLKPKPMRVLYTSHLLEGLEGHIVSTRVFAGNNSSFLVIDFMSEDSSSVDQKVFACGLNANAQLGFPTPGEPTVRRFTEVEALSKIEHIDSIVANQQSAALLTSYGHVYTFGYAEESGLGHNRFQVDQAPQRLTFSDSGDAVHITQIAAGLNHFVACSAAGDFYSWGCGEDNQLANNPPDVSQPQVKWCEDMEANQAVRPYKVDATKTKGRLGCAVAAGAQHSIFGVFDHRYDLAYKNSLVYGKTAGRKRKLEDGSPPYSQVSV